MSESNLIISISRSNFDMKLSRLVGLIFAAVLAMGLMAVSAAYASPPEFLPGTPQTFKSDSGTGKLEISSGVKVECLTDLDTGEVTGPTTVGNVVVTFHNCHGVNKSAVCSVKSTGGPNTSLIITNTLDGVLGSVKPAEAASGVGLLLLPTVGTEFVALEGTCLPVSPSPTDGTVAGEVTPIGGALTLDGILTFKGNGEAGKNLIRTINVLGVVKEPRLKALGLLEANEITVDLILYSKDVVVC
jgi:hypothetical protein